MFMHLLWVLPGAAAFWGLSRLLFEISGLADGYSGIGEGDTNKTCIINGACSIGLWYIIAAISKDSGDFLPYWPWIITSIIVIVISMLFGWGKRMAEDMSF